MSSLEKIIYAILKNNNINFIQEKCFEDCYNGYYKFDFYIPDLNTCIECNGAQHYKYVKHFHKKKTDFTKAQERDRRKINYCLAKGIKLYIIPYWDIENIINLDSIFVDKFIASSQYHNDIEWKKITSK